MDVNTTESGLQTKNQERNLTEESTRHEDLSVLETSNTKQPEFVKKELNRPAPHQNVWKTSLNRWNPQHRAHKENVENFQQNPLSDTTQHPIMSSSDSKYANRFNSSTPSSDGLSFIHEDERFMGFIKMCAEERGIDPSLVEKDYFVSHALWCLRKRGLEIQIKGGVSLSKGFGIVNRLSEDVDIIIRPNPSCSSFLQDIVVRLDQIDMKSKLKTRERALLWRKFANLVKNNLSGFNAHVADKSSPFYEPRWIHCVLHASYANIFPTIDENLMPSEIILEFSTATDEPLKPIPMRLSSFIHNYLESKHMLHQFKRNIPTVLCTHPMITLIQKISDGIVNRFARSMAPDLVPMPPFASGLRGKVPPFDPRIIRHYEDAAAIIANITKCHSLSKPGDYQRLYVQLMERRMVRRKIDAGTTINGDESLLLLETDAAKIEALRLCQQQRICLHYDRNDRSHMSSRSSSLKLEDCAFIIREWLVGVGL